MKRTLLAAVLVVVSSGANAGLSFSDLSEAPGTEAVKVADLLFFEAGTTLKPESLGAERAEIIMVAYPGQESAFMSLERDNATDIDDFARGEQESVGPVRRGDSENIADDVQVAPTVSPIPEPEIYAMMAVGLGLLGWIGRRKKLQAAT